MRMTAEITVYQCPQCLWEGKITDMLHETVGHRQCPNCYVEFDPVTWPNNGIWSCEV